MESGARGPGANVVILRRGVVNTSFPQRACQPKELQPPTWDESCTSAAAQRKGGLQADDSHGPRLQKCATFA